MKTVTLKVNEKRLVSNLGLAFTNSFTVITELAQNARRAKATLVNIDYDASTETLIVSDNGHGIDDFSVLLDVAQSGWEKSVKDSEKAFGIGFLSALYSAERIKVKSNRCLLVAKTEDLLNFSPVEIQNCELTEGTFVELKGVKINEKLFKPENLFMGFPIRVVYNGEEIARDHAIECGKSFIKTDVGVCHIKGLEDDSPKRTITRSTVFYYQGFPVGKTGSTLSLRSTDSRWFLDRPHYSETDNICHVDELKYDCRLPDRDKLIDQEMVFSAFFDVYQNEWVENLKKLRNTQKGEDFVRWYIVLNSFGLLELLNDVDVLPQEAIHVVEDYPVHRSNTEDNQTSKLGVFLTRQDIESGKYVVFEMLEDIDPIHCNEDEEEDARLWVAAYESSRIVTIGCQLHADHWLHQYAHGYDDVKVSFSGSREPRISGSDGLWNVMLKFCNDITLTVPDHDPIIISGDAALLKNEEGKLHLFVPDGCTDGEGVLQAQSFKDEFDNYDDNQYEECREKLETFIRNDRLTSPDELLSHILSDANISSFPALLHKAFTVHISDSGSVKVIEQS